MTAEPASNQPEDTETEHADAAPDPKEQPATGTEDQAENMEFEGDTPN
ncbi:hypothetical protein [Nocardia sp. NPDC049149]